MKLLDVGGHTLYPTIGIFGMSGVGKTSLSATAGKLIIADSNEGTMSLDHVPDYEGKIRRVRIHDMPDLDELYDNLTGTGGKDWSKRFKAASFDHFDDIQQIILGKLAERAQDARDEPDEIQQREWGIMANKLRRYLRKIKRIPLTKILIMGEKYMDQEGWMYPSLQGQMRDAMPYFLDHCLYVRMSRTRPHPAASIVSAST
ncbi:MAG: ATP-binding protein [Actinobacteria bacterium]|nr:ATP-binding protein [Actinomycetota bacterium]